MKAKDIFLIALALLSMRLGVTLAVAVADRPTEESPAPGFREHMEYFVRDGGVWITDNSDFVPGGNSPKSFTYRYRWTLFEDVIHFQIGGILANGEEVTYWEDMVFFDPREESIRIYQFGPNGALLSGTTIPGAEGVSHTLLEGHSFDGKPLSVKEITEITGPDEFRSTSYRRVGGEWRLQAERLWKR